MKLLCKIQNSCLLLETTRTSISLHITSYELANEVFLAAKCVYFRYSERSIYELPELIEEICNYGLRNWDILAGEKIFFFFTACIAKLPNNISDLKPLAKHIYFMIKLLITWKEPLLGHHLWGMVIF